jgi:hypothetical protein
MAALYHLDGNTTDATGRRGALSLTGNTRVDSSNLGWMAERAGGALRFQDLGDEARVELPVSAVKSADTSEIVLRDVAAILSLNETWNAYVELIEDKYAGPFIKGGTTLSFTKPELTAALTAKTWHHLSMAVTRTAYVIKLNGQVVASIPTTDLANWGRAQTVTLKMGHFDGWIDEIAVRNVRTTSGTTASLTPMGPNQGGFRMRVSGQAGATYRIEASADSRTWASVGTVTLSASTAEFTDPAKGPRFRMYRAVKL